MNALEDESKVSEKDESESGESEKKHEALLCLSLD